MTAALFDIARDTSKKSCTIIPYTQGDSLVIDVLLLLPGGEPATENNSIVRAVLANRKIHDSIIWEGNWDAGVETVNYDTGYAKITIPRKVTDILPRGSYLLSVHLSSKDKAWSKTVAEMTIISDYSAGSPFIDVHYVNTG